MNEVTISPKAETIVFLGPPGSGKDTQIRFLVDKLGYKEISSGDLVRLRAQHDKELRQILAEGKLAPNEIVDDEMISVFALLPEDQPVIINGYPRTLDQARKLIKILDDNGRKIDRVIYIKVDDKEIEKRISKRRVCTVCGHFTDDSHKKCPECGGDLKIREDDKPEAVKKRIEIFHRETEPVIDFFKKEFKFFEVDGNPSIEEVKENIRRIL